MRSVHLRGKIAESVEALDGCDVLISHEPPQGVLDLTYGGVRAGSDSLRRAVETSDTKPRLWLCGHIHEGRGAARESFVSKAVNARVTTTGRGRVRKKTSSKEEETKREDDGGTTSTTTTPASTLVVNAANANFGKANRLVAGSVLVDVYREDNNVVVNVSEEDDRVFTV